MPTYEYRCADCGHEFETVQSFTDDALTECPECGGRLKKVFGNVGIAFKGSGFYVTDSAGNGSKTTAAPAASDSADKSEGGSSSDSSGSDSATKTDSSGSKSDSKSTASTSTSSSE